jgi:hypothetical protein
MTATYEMIATNTVTGSSVADVTFSTISGSYTDIVVVAQIKIQSTTSATVFQLNGDTGSNYSYTVLTGTGSAANSSRATNATYGIVDFNGYPPTAANTFNAVLMSFNNYSNSTTNKTVLSRANSAGSGVDALVSLWRNTAAITSIKFFNTGANISVGSTFTLYGIKAE